MLLLKQPGSSQHFLLVEKMVRLRDGVRRKVYSSTGITLGPDGRGSVDYQDVDLWPDGRAQITAIPMCGRNGYWIIGHEGTGNTFIIWAFDSSGLHAPRTQRVGSNYAADDVGWDANEPGYMKSSVDGRRLAVGHGGKGPYIEIFDFDALEGRLLDTGITRIRFDHTGPFTPYGAQGVSFSPDGRKLYATEPGGGRILQFDVSTRDSTAVALSRRVIVTSANTLSGLQLGPDGRLYCAVHLAPQLIVINSPDSTGIAIGLDRSGVTFAGRAHSGLDLPNMVDADLGLRRVAAPALRACRGDSVRFSVGWVFEPQWVPAAGLSCTDCLEPTAAPDSTTTYYLFSGSGGCGPVDSVLVTVDQFPSVRVTGDTLICPGQQATLEVISTGTVRWLPADGISCSDCPRMSVYPRGTTFYRFEVTGANGCRRRDSVCVVVAEAPRVSAGPDRTICAGGSVQLMASGGARFRWEPLEGLSCTDCPDPVASPLQSTVYTVTAWTDAGCSATARVRVLVADAITVDAGADRTICAGDSVQLAASGAEFYRWDDAEELSCRECAAPTVRPSASRTYYVTGTSGDCSARDSVRLTVEAAPALVIAGDSVVCAGGTARIVVSGADSYRWSADGEQISCSPCNELELTPSQTTLYRVEATSAAGCRSVDSFVVRVVDQPEIIVDGGGEICQGEALQLHARGGSAYRWEPVLGLSCSDCPDPVATPAATTLYRVTGSVPGGCFDTATVTVIVREAQQMHAWLPRDVRLLPGGRALVAVTSDQSFRGDLLELAITWRPTVVSLTAIAPAAGLVADGWRLENVQQTVGIYRGRLVRASPGTVAPGTIAELNVVGFVGDTSVTELSLAMSSGSECDSITTSPGLVRIDSICGLNFRLMEFTAGLWLERPVPNPASSTVRVRFGLPASGRAELVAASADGFVRVLWAGEVAEGEHEAELATTDLPSGVYSLQLRFGAEVRQQRAVIVR